MPDSENREFIREQIIDKAVGRRHRIRKIGLRILGAAGFGLVAAVVFLLCVRWLGDSFFPVTDPEKPSEEVVIGRDDEENGEETQPPETKEEVPPETTAGEEPSTESQTEEDESNGEAEGETRSDEEWRAWMEAIATGAAASKLKEQDGYLAESWYRLMSATLRTVNKGLVTINCTTEGLDWFSNPVSSFNPACGAVIYVTDAEILILADYDSIREAEALTVVFCDGTTVDARVKKADTTTGIAIVSVSKATLSETTLNKILTLTLGNSYQVSAGTPVMAAGSPLGYTGSVLEGMISLVQKNTIGTDTSFQLIYADISAAESGEGFLFNTAGELVGILTDRYGDAETGLPVAIGISSLKGIMEALSSGIDVAYLGIQGQNATASVAENHGMPVGIYVTKVVADSPAYEAGLKAGDILVSSDQADLTTMQKLQNFLESYSTGDAVKLQVYREAQDEYVPMEFSVTLGAR